MVENNKNSSKTEIEDNYSAHQDNPGPAPQALKEKPDKNVGRFLGWLLAIIALVLGLIWLFI